MYETKRDTGPESSERLGVPVVSMLLYEDVLRKRDRYREALATIHDVIAWVNENEPNDHTRWVEAETLKALNA